MFERAVSLAFAGLVATLICTTTICRAEDVLWVPTGSDDYNVAENWNVIFVPELSAQFQDVATINNGGTAVVGGPVQDNAGVKLLNGGLQINRGGSLSTGTSFGATGALTQATAGTLTMGDLTGASAASFHVAGPATLGGTTNLLGPNINFTAASFELTGTLNTTVTAGGHSVLTTTGNASVGGVLQLDFDGVVPQMGATWNIINAASISGPGFNRIMTSAELGRGQYFTTQQVAGGNGTLLQATIAEGLFLSANRATGEVRLVNSSATRSVELDGYLVTSFDGNLAPAQWKSFNSQGRPDFIEANATPTHLGEASLEGTRLLGPNSYVSLGYFLDTNSLILGNSDLKFSYREANGFIHSATVEYTGPVDGVSLFVDADGRAHLRNESNTDVAIDGYYITSQAGSLNPAGWTSIESGDPTWTEANPSATHIGELNYDGHLIVAKRGGSIDFGMLFDPNSTADLTFEYRVLGEGVKTGAVLYNATPFTFLDGDYDFDEDVDADDYLVWKTFFGSTTQLAADGNLDGVVDAADYTIWRNNLGATASALVAVGTPTAVPEPITSGGMLLATLAGLWFRRRVHTERR